jgi:hypothetical protein
MEASMRMRLDLIDDLLQQHLSLTDTAPVKSDMMQEFEVVLTQMPYVGGAESRMSDFFMRLLGFMAIGRVLQRRGVPKDGIAELELESFKRHMLTVSEGERLEAGRKFMSDDSKALIREPHAVTNKNTKVISCTIMLNPARMTPSSSVSTTAPAGFANSRPMGIGKSSPISAASISRRMT